MESNSIIAGTRNARILWAERLGIPDLLTAVLSQPFYRIVIFYSEHGESLLAGIALKLLRRYKIGLNIFPMSLSLEKESPDGDALVYKVDEEMRLCGEIFLQEHASGTPLRTKNAIKCYMSTWLRNRISFAVIAGSKSRSMRGKCHVIRFTRHPMNETICHLCRDRGFIVKESFDILSFIRRAALILKLTMGVIKARMVHTKPASNMAVIRPSIWVEYDCKSNADFSFWKKQVNSALFDIVYYLDRKNTPAIAKIADEINKDGALWIDAHLEAMASNISISLLISLMRDLFRSSGRPFWFKVFNFEYGFWITAYKECFKRYKVKMLVQHQDTSWMQEVQAAAIESSGGIMVGFHWSNYPCRMTPVQLFPSHVFFIWGSIFSYFLPKEDIGSSYLLPCGVWICRDEVALEAVTRRLKDLKFTFSIFDSSCAYNIHQTPSSLSRFYAMLLGLLEKNVSWGAIVKTKSGDIDRLLAIPDGEELVRRFRSLAEVGRVFFLSSQLTPVTAAALTDVSVCYGFNSAGIVAGANGYRALHWDCAGWTLHPIYKDREQKILFRTLDELEASLIKAGNGDTSIGDFSAWEQKFNHFIDHGAGKRVGQFIEDFMSKVIYTGDAMESLEEAVKIYRSRNNVDDSFFSRKDILAEELVGKIC